jgi:3-hydroxyacyl-[acyl-carrier-protein] dehydratase
MSELLFGPKDLPRLLPHRHPFLLLDGIKSFNAGERLVAVKAVAGSEWYFAGHFPDFPIMPGVLVIEALAQACSVYGKLNGIGFKPGSPLPVTEGTASDTLGVLGSVKVQLKKPVFPGVVLDLVVEVVKEAGPSTFFDVRAEVNGEVHAQGSIIVSNVDRRALG